MQPACYDERHKGTLLYSQQIPPSRILIISRLLRENGEKTALVIQSLYRFLVERSHSALVTSEARKDIFVF